MADRAVFEDWKEVSGWVKERCTQEAINRITRCTVRILNTAKLLVPVDTGNLRRSLQREVYQSGDMVYGFVGTNCVYAYKVEHGLFGNRPKKNKDSTVQNANTNAEGETVNKASVPQKKGGNSGGRRAWKGAYLKPAYDTWREIFKA